MAKRLRHRTLTPTPLVQIQVPQPMARCKCLLKISGTGNVEHFSGDQHKPPRCKQGLVVHFGQTVRADIYLALRLELKAAGIQDTGCYGVIPGKGFYFPCV